MKKHLVPLILLLLVSSATGLLEAETLPQSKNQTDVEEQPRGIPRPEKDYSFSSSGPLGSSSSYYFNVHRSLQSFSSSFASILASLFRDYTSSEQQTPTDAWGEELVYSVRINCGGGAFTDSTGTQWAEDTFYNADGASVVGFDAFRFLFGTQDADVYQTWRSELGWLAESLVYTIPMDNGAYEVTLWFPNRLILFGKFVIWAQGLLAFSSDDFTNNDSAPNQAVAVTIRTQVAEEELVLEFVPEGSEAYVAAIEVVPVSASGEFETILINAGGDLHVDVLGRTWLADSYFTGGSTFSISNLDVIGTQDDYIYQTERCCGSFSYEIPVPSGDYEIILHFAEIWFTEERSRLFDITMEGNTVFSNIDLVQLGEGQNDKALTLESPQQVTDGAISISFISVSFTDRDIWVVHPKVSGIEINLLGDHLAHAVASGPYFAADSDNDGSESVVVDGFLSHT